MIEFRDPDAELNRRAAELEHRGVELERPTAARDRRTLAWEGLGAFMGRYWRGEERLWKAFWLFGMGGGMAAGYLVGLVREVVLDSQMWIGVGLIFWGLATAGAVGYLVWAYVAIWRSAFNVGWKGWGYVCRAVVVLQAMLMVSGLAALMTEWGELL